MADSAITIRPIRPADRPDWHRLWMGYLAFYEVELDPAITTQLWQRLMDPKPEILGRVAVADKGAVIGLVHLVPHKNTWTLGDVCYLEDLYVEPAVRGQGVGRRLIEAAFAEGRERGWNRVYWMTRSNNRPARALYDKLALSDDFVRYTARVG